MWNSLPILAKALLSLSQRQGLRCFRRQCLAKSLAKFAACRAE